MYAIVESGGKQYRVEEGTKIFVERLNATVGNEVVLNNVLMIGGKDCRVGTPYLSGVSVVAEVIKQARGPKIMVFKRWRRNDSRKKKGHRQDYTHIRIKSINA